MNDLGLKAQMRNPGDAGCTARADPLDNPGVSATHTLDTSQRHHAVSGFISDTLTLPRHMRTTRRIPNGNRGHLIGTAYPVASAESHAPKGRYFLGVNFRGTHLGGLNRKANCPRLCVWPKCRLSEASRTTQALLGFGIRAKRIEICAHPRFRPSPATRTVRCYRLRIAPTRRP